MSEQRERFEAWASEYHDLRKDRDGFYIDGFAFLAWKAWQAACPEGWQVVPKKITAETGHKYALIGEFNESITLTCPECHDCDELDEHCYICSGEGEFEQPVPVTWDTIKRIHDAVVSVSAAPKPGDV